MEADGGDGGEGRARGSGRLVAAGVAVFLVAVLMARLLLAPGDLWVGFLVAVPVLLVVLGLAFGALRAAVLVAFFACSVLGVRWLVREGPGWPVILLLPVLALSLGMVLKVLATLRRLRREARALPTEATGARNGGKGEREEE